jgi:DnaJ-class molecular chaperone
VDSLSFHLVQILPVRSRAARSASHGFEATEPVTQGDAYELLGVTAGCSPEELAAAYRRKMSQWHPDKLDSMAQELKDYATRRTVRINEAYQRLKHRA